MDSYYHKYRKYKKKYHQLKISTYTSSMKRQRGTNSTKLVHNPQYNFYLLHGSDIVHLETMLQQGFIYSGRYLPPETIRLGGWEKLPYIYCSIFFNDLHNLPYSFGYSLILNPSIILNEGIIFNKGWNVHPTEDSIIIQPNDPMYNNKIQQIHDYLEKPNKPSMIPALMHHEVLIKNKIDLHKYLVALILPGMDFGYENISNILNENNYNNISIFTELPSLDELNL